MLPGSGRVGRARKPGRTCSHRDKGSPGSSKEKVSWDQAPLWALARAGHFSRATMPRPPGQQSANTSQPFGGHDEGRLFQPRVCDLRGDAA